MVSHTIEADVVVVGAGPAGMAAAAAARTAGAEVVLVEALDVIGGNAIWSTGYIAFVDSDMQRNAGISDSADDFLRDAEDAADLFRSRYGVFLDTRLVRLFAEESRETYRDLIRRGARLERFIPRPRQHRIDRMIALDDASKIASYYADDLSSPGVTTLLKTRAERLIRDGDSVVGLLATTDAAEDPVRIIARQGVILTSGGYQANPALRARYQPGYQATRPYLGVDTGRGDAHLLAQSVGADLINMTIIPPVVIVASAMVEEMIAVNVHGDRFHDEAGPYEYRIDEATAQPDELAFYIWDAETSARKAMYVEQMPDEVHTADTLEQLAALIHVDPDGLVRSVAQWNTFLASEASTDAATGRVSFANDRHGIASGPFSASRMVVGCSFISGGMTVTASMQVVDVFGDAIPGLFAAGDCVGGFNPCIDLGGIHLGGGLTLGRVAGRSAATGDLAPPHTQSPFGQYLPSRLGAPMEIVHVENA